eukprot:CAMPEP_0197187982 /NCGR_PEP_ID=MMETSP1423-20130617/16979_1 /TAXON_ID=476441 /ORGANISM="Pseudo-nitzschia heimii, Strain UNC1101" /LENGTH=301 /DNA_ID=CAMNT_0042639705 /DNA_START=23 /DNA_END=928 /DNA_ORIENTATION=-
MSNTRPEVRSMIKNMLKSQDGYNSKVDVLRAIEEEAILMKQTQHALDMLDSDPMEQLSLVKPQIDHLKKIIEVISYSRIRTNDYGRIDAVVGFKKSDDLKLTFRYEQKRRKEEDGRLSRSGFHIRYSIEMSVNHQQRRNLIVIELWTANDGPSTQKAVCINQMLEIASENDNDWEDIECGGDKDHENLKSTLRHSNESSRINRKRQRLDSSQESSGIDHPIIGSANYGDEQDSYSAYLDPETLHEFLELAAISTEGDEMHEGTAFFLLMTFPFYEHEWDLVGYLLEEIFGDGEDEEEEDSN